MLKHIILIILLSLGIVLGMTYAHLAVSWLLAGHDWIANVLTNVFSEGQAGNIARELIALLSIPILVGLIPAIIYWMAKRTWFPYFMDIVWVIWLIQAGALVMTSAGGSIGG